jgi:hypothetical protein
MIRPLGQLFSCVEPPLAITEKLEALPCRDIAVGGVKSGEIVLYRGVVISNNVTMGHTNLQVEGLHHMTGRTG